MKLVAQDVRLPITNLDFGANELARTRHSPLFPNNVRMLIVGTSGCGKTNVMVHMITNPNGLRFKNIYIYSKSLYQPKYLYLAEILKNVPEINYETFSNTNEVLPPGDVREDSLFIFDDVICDKQENMKNYFSMGRHKNVDCFYLSQSYAKVPKLLIRENANVLILFKQDEMSMKHVYQDHVSPDISFAKFLQMCNKIWNEKYSFVMIDKESNLNDGRYRKGLDQYVDISSL
jgi:Poxvirus A32 protein